MKRLLLIALLMFSGLAQAAVPTISCSATRTTGTGVAPLGVFVDCTATTDDGTSAPFHDLHYEHSFGDTTAGTWAYGSRVGNSKNYATGPMAAHIFETAGTFTITSRACDATGCAQTTNSVTVTSADDYFTTTNTLCVGNVLPVAGSGGCPTGASVLESADFDSAISTYIATKKRILFNRGDTFTSSTPVVISIAGPGLIGAYGSGAKPIVEATNTAIFTLSSSSTPTTVTDWRIMDLYLDGNSGTSSEIVTENGGFDQVTFLRIDATAIGYGFHTSGSLGQYWNSAGSPGHRIHSEYFIVDSTIASMSTGNYVAFFTGYKSALMGNSFYGGTGFRFPQLVKVVVSNNTVTNTTNTKEVIKLHAPTACNSTETGDAHYSAGCTYLTDTFPPTDNAMWTDNVKTFGYSELIQISDNKLIQGAAGSAVWVASLGPQNGNSDERVRNLIFERNWIIPNATSNAMINVFMRNATLRNNLCHVTLDANYPACFLVASWGIEPPSDTVSLYNNTAYGSQTNSEFFLADIRSQSTNVLLKNNLAYFPNAGTRNLRNTSYTPGSGFVESNNSTQAQVQSTSPSFAGSTNPVDFRSTAGAAYPNTGGTAIFPATTSDFFGCADSTGIVRIGAFVPKANARCKGGK